MGEEEANWRDEWVTTAGVLEQVTKDMKQDVGWEYAKKKIKL